VQGLQELGWTDGRNVRSDYRWHRADGPAGNAARAGARLRNGIIVLRKGQNWLDQEKIVRLRYIDPGTGEADDVSHLVPVHIRQLARIEVVAAPTTGARRERRKFKRGRCKVPVAGGQDRQSVGKGEGDDVSHLGAVHIRQLARIEAVAGPTTGARRERRKFKRGRCKVPVAGGQ